MQNQRTQAKKIDFSDLPDLTPQQYKFAELVLAGNTASEAYRRAYNCENSSQRTIWAEASRLRNHPNVSAWIEGARIAGLERTALSKDQYISMLLSAAEEAKQDGNHGARMQSLVHVGKALGYFSETVVHTSNDPGQLFKELEAEDPEYARRLAAQLNWQSDDPPPSTH